MDDLVKRLYFSSCATCRDALAEIERLRKEVEYTKGPEFSRRLDIVTQTWRGKVERLTAERDTFYMDYRMKADAITKALHIERDSLRKEVEALRADAERWRLYCAWQNGEANPPVRWADYTFEERAYAVDDVVITAAMNGKGAA